MEEDEREGFDEEKRKGFFEDEGRGLVDVRVEGREGI